MKTVRTPRWEGRDTHRADRSGGKIVCLPTSTLNSRKLIMLSHEFLLTGADLAPRMANNEPRQTFWVTLLPSAIEEESEMRASTAPSYRVDFAIFPSVSR